eukprot:jgi/Botrbrau1/4159/Bobra.0192s0027.1
MLRSFTSILGVLLLCRSEARPLVIKLDDRSFEHQTQASTGQTTGNWYVLFTGHDVFVDDWERIAKEYREIDPAVIFAYVDLVANPGIKDRFSIRQIPQAYLFKDRKMYIYSDSWGPDDLEENLKDFLSTNYASTQPLTVPPPRTPLDGILKTLQGYNNYIILGGAAAVIGVFALLLLAGTKPAGKRS